jgi:hypothetical protein
VVAVAVAKEAAAMTTALVAPICRHRGCDGVRVMVMLLTVLGGTRPTAT